MSMYPLKIAGITGKGTISPEISRTTGVANCRVATLPRRSASSKSSSQVRLLTSLSEGAASTATPPLYELIDGGHEDALAQLTDPHAQISCVRLLAVRKGVGSCEVVRVLLSGKVFQAREGCGVSVDDY